MTQGEETGPREPIRKFTIHLISDATGTTLHGLTRACLAQFDGIEPEQKFWPMTRTKNQLQRILDRIEDAPGPVLFTFVDRELREMITEFCHERDIPCLAVLEPIIKGLSAYLGLPSKDIPGLQHALDEAYFRRVEAVEYALTFDDGRNMEGLRDADVVLLGVSRVSKTPTCIYLARQGIHAANIPLVPGVPLDESQLKYKRPLYIGLTISPDRLVTMRRNRLKANPNDPYYTNNAYLDPYNIEEEIRAARRLYAKHGIPVIDVTRRSVEETAAEIMKLLQLRKEREKDEAAARES